MQRRHDISINFGNGVITGPRSDFALLGYDGITNMSTDSVISEFSTAAGGVVKSIRPKTRVMTFEIENHKLSWSQMCALFPIGKYKISITRDDVTRYIEAWRYEELAPIGDGGALDIAGLQVSFIAEFPFFRQKLTEEIAVIGSPSGGMTYPHKYPVAFDTRNFKGELEINNEGPYSTPFVFSMTSDSDTAEVVIAVNQSTMTIRGDIQAGKKFIVDTGEHTATLGGDNIFDFVTGWPKLRPGINYISVSGAIGDSSIAFSPLFEGV